MDPKAIFELAVIWNGNAPFPFLSYPNSVMVCTACEAKLAKVCVPDKWKDGARNTVGPVKAGKTNKALAKLKTNAQWIPSETVCR